MIHPTAIIDKDVQIGEGTRVWHFSHVSPGARIGRSCVLGQNVYIGPHVTIGDNVRIQNNVSIYEGVEIEDDVFCGPSCVFTNVTNPRASLKRPFTKTRICRGATIGANATIVCGTTIGNWAFVGAGAVITKDVLDYALMIGVPARREGWMSRNGIRLEPDADGSMVCPESGLRYREVEGRCVVSA